MLWRTLFNAAKEVYSPLFEQTKHWLIGERNLADTVPEVAYKYFTFQATLRSLRPEIQEKKIKNTSYQLKISIHIQHFSQFTSYVNTLLIKVTYIQVWLHPLLASKCFRKK